MNARRSALMRKMKTVSHQNILMKFGKLQSDEDNDHTELYSDGNYLEMVETGGDNNDGDMKSKLNEIMNEYGFTTKKKKQEFLSEWIDEKGQEEEQQLDTEHDETNKML